MWFLDLNLVFYEPVVFSKSSHKNCVTSPILFGGSQNYRTKFSHSEFEARVLNGFVLKATYIYSMTIYKHKLELKIQ